MVQSDLAGDSQEPGLHLRLYCLFRLCSHALHYVHGAGLAIVPQNALVGSDQKGGRRCRPSLYIATRVTHRRTGQREAGGDKFDPLLRQALLRSLSERESTTGHSRLRIPMASDVKVGRLGLSHGECRKSSRQTPCFHQTAQKRRSFCGRLKASIQFKTT